MEPWEFYKKSVASMNGQFNTHRDAISKRLSGMGYKPTDERWISDMAKLEEHRDTEYDVLSDSSLVKNLQRVASGIQAEANIEIQGSLEKQLGRTPYNWEMKLEGV